MTLNFILINFLYLPISRTVDTVRLVNGNHTYQGRVEVFSGDSWLAVCDDDWDSYDARVVCRQLGFPYDNAQSVVNKDYDRNYYEPHFGRGSGQMWLTKFDCGLGNTNLNSCGHKQSGSCNHRRDVGVICNGSNGKFNNIDENH